MCILGSRQEERRKRSWDEHELRAAGCNVEVGVLRGADAGGYREEQGTFLLLSSAFHGEVDG